MHYTFILDRDNNTRYFLVQIVSLTIPASLGLVYFLKSKEAVIQQKILYGFCTLIFLYSAIDNGRPKGWRPEYTEFSRIIQNDTSNIKYAFEFEDGFLIEEKRLNYYSGIKMKTYNELEKYEGTAFIYSEKELEGFEGFKLLKLSEIDGYKKRRVYLYKTEIKIDPSRQMFRL